MVGGPFAPAVSVIALGAAPIGVASGAAFVGLMGRANRTLVRASREAEETGQRLRVLVEHVPAAVYIDMADPGVSDGGRLAYMSPQITAMLGYRPDELIDDP